MQSRFNIKTILFVAVMAVVLLLYSLEVLRTPDRAMEDLLVFEEGDRIVLQVKFGVPVRYESHYPPSEGDFVQVKLRTVSLGTGDNEYIGRESMLRGFAEQIPVTDVAFEPKVPGGPLLSLRFSDSTRYEVAEDLSNKSILIRLPKTSRAPRS